MSGRFSISGRVSVLGAWLLNYFSADDLTGFGFDVAAGPKYYLDAHAYYGVSLLVGYRYLSVSGNNYYWGQETYNGSSVYATLCFCLLLSSG